MRELVDFGLKQARACLFPGLLILAMGVAKVAPLGPLTRYDFLFLAAVAIQAAMLAARLESWTEVKVLGLFHLLGLGLEIFKTSPGIGSWSYPDPGFLKVAGVPLYSGFMYAAIGSYMCQAWRILDLELVDYPPRAATIPLCAAIYANYFTHHYVPDVRWILAALVAIVFVRTRVLFTARTARRRMPLALSFLLIGFFVWVAENLSTALGAWVYPNQRQGWAFVHPGKISSWALLVILSFILVAELKHLKARIARPS